MRNFKFTLIEMVIVCAILLFLSAGLFALGNVLFKKYYIMQGKMEMLKIQNGIAAYKSATGNFPPDYKSSSHNEDASGNGVGRWAAPIYMNAQWEGFQQAKDVYDKFTPPYGCPKALVQYNGPYGIKWGVWTWDWNEDIGGRLPNNDSGTQGGYVCQNPNMVTNSVGAVQSTFGTNFPSNVDPNTGLAIMSNFIKIGEAEAINVQTCGDTENFVCGNSDPNDNKFSCGWHNFKSETWEGAYNSAEMSKALYDYLCRPMKGRMKEGVPVNPKFENAKPFIEVSNKLIRPSGKPPTLQCNGEPMQDNPNNYKRYGDGLYNMTDSFEIIDVWGEPYFYISSAKEYTIASNNYTIKPYQSYWLSDSTLGANESYGFDLYPPFYNPGSYDLGSKGPDKRMVNWIPMDYKLEAPSGYHKTTTGDEKNYYIFGQPGEEGLQNKFIVLPSDSLKLLDYDNDNINNFSENSN